MEKSTILAALLPKLPAGDLRDQLMSQTDLPMVTQPVAPSSARLFKALVNKGSVGYVATLAENETDPARIDMLLRDRRVAVRSALARNPNLSDKQRKSLMNIVLRDGRWEIAATLASRAKWQFADVSETLFAADDRSERDTMSVIRNVLDGTCEGDLAQLGRKFPASQLCIVQHARTIGVDPMPLTLEFGRKLQPVAFNEVLSSQQVVDLPVAKWIRAVRTLVDSRVSWGSTSMKVTDEAATFLLEHGTVGDVDALAACDISDHIFEMVAASSGERSRRLSESALALGYVHRASLLARHIRWVSALGGLCSHLPVDVVQDLLDRANAEDRGVLWTDACARLVLGSDISYPPSLIAGVLLKTGWAPAVSRLMSPSMSGADKVETVRLYLQGLAAADISQVNTIHYEVLRSLLSFYQHGMKWPKPLLLESVAAARGHFPMEIVVEEMGDATPMQWQTLIDLWPDWEGNIKDLIALASMAE